MLTVRSAEYAGFLKTEITGSILLRRSDDYMIQKTDLKDVRAIGNAPCQSDIGFARGGIAGWMIVNEDEAICRVTDRRFKDFAGMRETFV